MQSSKCEQAFTTWWHSATDVDGSEDTARAAWKAALSWATSLEQSEQDDFQKIYWTPEALRKDNK